GPSRSSPPPYSPGVDMSWPAGSEGSVRWEPFERPFANRRERGYYRWFACTICPGPGRLGRGSASPESPSANRLGPYHTVAPASKYFPASRSTGNLKGRFRVLLLYRVLPLRIVRRVTKNC